MNAAPLWDVVRGMIGKGLTFAAGVGVVGAIIGLVGELSGRELIQNDAVRNLAVLTLLGGGSAAATLILARRARHALTSGEASGSWMRVGSKPPCHVRLSSVSRVAARWIAVTLALAVLPACVSVRYQRSGSRITPRAGETLVFGRVRFFHDGREFFPWNVSLVAPPVGTNTERHLWLLRLGRRAVSAEVHPDPDGSLAIWLASGDYALLGSTQLETSGAPPYEVVALVRVPAGPVAAYTGELNMKTETHEGDHLSYSELGDKSVILLPIAIARVTLEQRLGTLWETPVLSPWCVGDRVPGFNDAKLATRGKELLDRGCDGAR